MHVLKLTENVINTCKLNFRVSSHHPLLLEHHIRINSGSCYLLAAYKYTDLLLDSLQGFVVAVTFCYRNGEVSFREFFLRYLSWF